MNPDPTQRRKATNEDWWFVTRRRFSRIGTALCLMILAWIAVQLIIAAVLRVQGVNADTLPMWAQLIMGNGPLYVLAMPLAVLIMQAVPRLHTRRFSLGFGRFLTLLVICVPIMYAGSFLGTVLSSMLSSGTAQNPIETVADSTDPLTAFVFMVIVAPIFEEWIFRRQLLDRLRRYGEVPAMLVSALAFGLYHLNLFQFFYAFGLGLVFAYVYLRTSRLRYSVGMHMIINLNGGIIAPHILSLVDAKTWSQLESRSLQADSTVLAQSGTGIMTIGLYGMTLFALIIAGIILLVRRRHRIEWYRAPEELPRATRIRTAIGNPGMLAYIVLCLALMAFTVMSASL